MRAVVVACCWTLVAGCVADDTDDVDDTEAAALTSGPFAIDRQHRETRATARLTDPDGSLDDADVQVGPESGAFHAEASASVARGAITAAGVTVHDSSVDGRRLALDGHCDANTNVADTETPYGSASCRNDLVVVFTVSRSVKASFSAELSSARTGLAGGYGE